MARPIVADSSPLISAARAGELSLIQKVYQTIVIPEAVYTEIVVQGQGMPGADEVENARGKWIQVGRVTATAEIQALRQRLGAGESEAIVLAWELGAYLYADEAAVIMEARKRGIPITSTLMTLILAKERGLIQSVKEKLDTFVASGFRIDDMLYRLTIKTAQEA